MFDTKIPVYGILILLALFANIIIVVLLSKKYSFSGREILCLLLYENIGIIGGAKVLTFLLNYNELNGEFDILRVGFTAYGAVIGALAFLILFSLQFKKSLGDMLFIFMPSIPLMYGVGKIGCFLAGCCYGYEYDGFGSVVYNYSSSAPGHTHLFPVQIVEAIFFFAIFAVLMLIHKKNRFNSKTVGLNFVLCGFCKFVLDFFRDSHVGVLSPNQFISLAFIVIGSGVFLFFSIGSIKGGSVTMRTVARKGAGGRG